MKKIVDSCFDEEKTAIALLTFSKERRVLMKRLYENNSYPYIYVLIVKYLLKQEYSLDDILKILKRHALIVSYYIIKKESYKTKIKKWPDNEYLDELIKIDKIDIDTLNSNKKQESIPDSFKKLYYSCDFKTYKKEIATIISEYESAGKDSKWLSGLLKNFFNYFGNNCSFRDLNYYDHFDLVISHCMNDDKNLDKFDFECECVELNWISSQSSTIDFKKACLGQIINIIFQNNNLGFNKEMTFKVNYYYEIMLNEARKKNINGTINFFKVINPNERLAKIDVKELKEFNFKYNGKSYLFSKNGIIEI